MSSNLAQLNPIPFLKSLIGKEVIVKLKWGQEYKGTLMAFDKYMNFQVSFFYIKKRFMGLKNGLMTNVEEIQEKF